MSFLLDALLIAILVITVAANWRRSIFAAATDMVSTILAAAAAVALLGVLSAPVNDLLIAPAVEQAAANELADMYSAPHLSGGRETVAALPLRELVEEQPAAYLQLLEDYGVKPEAVAQAYRTNGTNNAVLKAITADTARGFSRAATLMTVTILITLLLGLISRRMEQNLPPQRAYRGVKRALPALCGFVGGIVWLWVLALALGWVAPAMSGHSSAFNSTALNGSDVYKVLTVCNPLKILAEICG